MEELFLSLINNSKYEIKDNNIWYNDGWIIEQDKKNKIIWFNYYRFWKHFESKFNLNHQENKQESKD